MTKKMYLPAGIKQEIVLRGYNFPELKVRNSSSFSPKDVLKPGKQLNLKHKEHLLFYGYEAISVLFFKLNTLRSFCDVRGKDSFKKIVHHEDVVFG